MSKLKVAVAIAISSVLFIFFACTTTDPEIPGGGEGYFTYDGDTYTLLSAVIDDWGANSSPDDSGYDLDFSVGTFKQSSWVPGPPVGIHSIISLDLNSPNPTLVSGTYTWSDTRTDFTLVDAICMLNADFQVGSVTYDWAIGGTVTLSVDRDKYTVEFTLNMLDGKTVTGRYSGTAQVFSY